MLLDTAGVREASDAAERIGVERSRAAARAADIAILVIDAQVCTLLGHISRLCQRCSRLIGPFGMCRAVGLGKMRPYWTQYTAPPWNAAPTWLRRVKRASTPVVAPRAAEAAWDRRGCWCATRRTWRVAKYQWACHRSACKRAMRWCQHQQSQARAWETSKLLC